MDFFSGFGLLYVITIWFTIIIVFLENREPSKTALWIIVLAFLPGIGFLLYLLFGENVRSKQYIRAQKVAENFLESGELKDVVKFERLVDEQRKLAESEMIFQNEDQKVIRLILNAGGLPVTKNNHVTLFKEGVEKFHHLLEDIERAEKHIHMEYFIIKNSEIGRKIRDALIRKAQQGVEVRLIYDDVGCRNLYQNPEFFRGMREEGCEISSYFLEKFPYIYRNINRRDHRKVVIIDGKVGYIGGINIGDEYIHKSKKFGFWRDTHLRIEGEAVYSLQLTFLLAWYMLTEEKIQTVDLFPEFENQSDENKSDRSVVQIATSEASTPQETIYQAYFSGIGSAEETICIQTPYFVPDEALLTALKTALLSGVKVKIMFPSFPDHFVVYHASHSYLEEVMELGAEVYFYKKGFLHSKVLVVDHSFASVGTLNMDIRSFSTNAEINAFLYDDDTVDELYNMFQEDLKDCIKVEYAQYKKKSFFKKMLEGFCRLFSPLL